MSCAGSTRTCRTYVARVSYPVVGAQTANERSRGLPLAGEVMSWLFTGKGMLTYSPSIVAASAKVLEEAATPDAQVTFAPGSFKGCQIGELQETPGLSAGAWQMRPLSRGYVEAKSNRPGEAPAMVGWRRQRQGRKAGARSALLTAHFRRFLAAEQALTPYVGWEGEESNLPCGAP
jgi:choline dehydrogenase